MSKRNSNARSRTAATTTNTKTKMRRRRVVDDIHEQGVSSGLVVSRPFTAAFTPDRPGRASLRTTFEAIGTARGLLLSNVMSGGYSDWFPQMVAILTPFCLFRITRLRFVTQVTGGAASLYTVAGNVTNDYTSADTNALSILNDDFAGVANAVHPLVLEPPSGYFQQGSLKWYPTQGPGTAADTSQGTLSMIGFGGDIPATVLGWHTVDVEVEFHTLR